MDYSNNAKKQILDRLTAESIGDKELIKNIIDGNIDYHGLLNTNKTNKTILRILNKLVEINEQYVSIANAYSKMFRSSSRILPMSQYLYSLEMLKEIERCKTNTFNVRDYIANKPKRI